MKISHEVPIAYLKASGWFNDYDYLLPHLYDKYPEYKEYFQEIKGIRYVVMDNSLHELGVPYSKGRLLSIIDEVQPNEFIVPDEWENAIYSMRNAKEWSFIELPENVKKVAVVQGKSFAEIIKCYQTYKWLGYKKIAFSYGANYYKEMFPHPNVNISKALGRQLVIVKMIEMGLIGETDEIHLLGCSIPQEFLYYNGIQQIKTIDTSNPIMAAYDGVEYNDWGLFEKPKTKIDDVINDKSNPVIYERIVHNIETFRKINNL